MWIYVLAGIKLTIPQKILYDNLMNIVVILKSVEIDLNTLIMMNQQVKHLNTSSRKNTQYWSAYIIYASYNASYCFQDYQLTSQTDTGLFSMLCSHSHTFRETSQKVTRPNTTPSQTSLTMEFFFVRLPKRRCILLV